MANLVERHREWKREHPDFPLTVHVNGQWSKKVRGKTVYFGPLADRDAALRLWLTEKDHLLAGLPLPTYASGLTVGDLCSQRIDDVEDRISAGKMSRTMIREYQTAGKLLTEAGLDHVPVRLLVPAHFIAILRRLEGSGRRLRTQKNLILSIRSIFNWGRKMGLYDTAINYGPDFSAPSITLIEAEQEENGVVRFFDRKLILAALKEADAKMRVAVFLGINCAFYPGDTKAITYGHVHLDALIPYHDFRRVKTRHKRMAVLWPETVAAIRDYTDHHRPQSEHGNILLTQRGMPYTGGSSSISLAEQFNAIIEKAGHRQRGVSLGSLRHTYGTVMDLVPDTPMIDLTMGHVAGTVRGQSRKSLQRRIYSQFNMNELKRLKAVADVVHDWLFDGKFSDTAVDGENPWRTQT